MVRSAAPALSAGRPWTLYKGWVVLLMLLMMMSNFVDRSIIVIVAQPIKEDLHITDFQIGLLGGFAFAILYTFMGIPIARLAERHNRVNMDHGSPSGRPRRSDPCRIAAFDHACLLNAAGRPEIALAEAAVSSAITSAISAVGASSRAGSIRLGVSTGIWPILSLRAVQLIPCWY